MKKPPRIERVRLREAERQARAAQMSDSQDEPTPLFREPQRVSPSLSEKDTLSTAIRARLGKFEVIRDYLVKNGVSTIEPPTQMGPPFPPPSSNGSQQYPARSQVHQQQRSQSHQPSHPSQHQPPHHQHHVPSHQPHYQQNHVQSHVQQPHASTSRNPTMSDPRLELKRPRQHDAHANHASGNNRRPTSVRPGEPYRPSAPYGNSHSYEHESQHAHANAQGHGQSYGHGRPPTQPPAKPHAQAPAQLPAQPQARPQANGGSSKTHVQGMMGRPSSSATGPMHHSRSAVRSAPYPMKPSSRPMNHTSTASRGAIPKVPVSGGLDKTEKKILPDMTAPLPVPGQKTESKPQRVPTSEDEEDFYVTF